MVFTSSSTVHSSRSASTASATSSVDRGPILIGSTPVAQSKPSNDRFQFQRTYASGPVYAPVTGYYSYLYGRAGIELTQNAELNGSDPSMAFRRGCAWSDS